MAWEYVSGNDHQIRSQKGNIPNLATAPPAKNPPNPREYGEPPKLPCRPQSSHVDGKVWTQNNGFAGVHRLDVATGKIETWEPFKNSPKGEAHNIYDVIPDSKNNAYFTDFRQQHVGRIDAKTGEVKLFEVPTARSAPRRGSMDA